MRFALLAIAALGLGCATRLDAQARSAQPATQRFQRTRDMHVACVGPDSARAFRRGIGDTLRVTRASGDTTVQMTGGTPRSREYPEYDVVLDIPNLCVERITLKVDSLTARVSLNAQVANLVRVSAGADVLIGTVDLTIQDVRASALLLVDLDDVVHIVDQTLTFVDNNPQIIQQLGSTLQNTVGAAGGLVRGLLLSVTKLANGNTLQRLVSETTGDIRELTRSAAGAQVAERVVGNVLDLPAIRETTDAAGNTVKRVRDRAGALLEYTLDKASQKLLGVKLIQGGAASTDRG